MENKKIINIVDVAFAHSTSSSLNNIPKHIEWCRTFNRDEEQDLIIFTDQCIFQKPRFKCKKSIFWLIEPVSTYPYSYSFVKENINHPDFADYILTYDKELCKLSDKVIFYPHSGSWIHENDFGIYPKTKMCSIILSNKKQTTGHRMRWAAVENFPDKFDIFGRGTDKPLDYKLDGLKDYRYSVIIENIKQDDYYTEKIIDSFSTATIPLFWGTDNIRSYFNEKGIIKFDTISELKFLIDNICCEQDYLSRMDAIKYNLEESYKYRIAEDFIYENILLPRKLV